MNIKLFFIVLTCIVGAYSATTKKSTKKAAQTTTKASTKTTVKTKVTECYQSFKGYYEDKFYNVSSPAKCSTNCFAFRESVGTDTLESGSCNDESVCIGGVFVTRYNYSFVYDCCTSNLCNTPEFNSKLNIKCESNKPVPKNKKLIFPIRKLNLPSVKQCYYCESCSSSSLARVVNCVERNSTIKNFACQHSFVNMGTNQYWTGDCVSVEDMVHVSYEKVNTKVVGCQGELCNSPTNMKKLEKTTLCLDGFYEE